MQKQVTRRRANRSTVGIRAESTLGCDSRYLGSVPTQAHQYPYIPDLVEYASSLGFLMQPSKIYRVV